VADRIGLSKSGVFSRVGSREALQKAVIEEFGRRFIADVFVPAMQLPKGLPRLDEIMQRWIARTRDVEAKNGCIYSAGAFELDDREGPLRDMLHSEVTRWRAALRRTVLQAVDAGHLKRDTDPEQLVGEACSIVLGLVHDARFLRDPRAAERTQASWQRLLASYTQ
jgi:AcrR family transcriptional regulator